jgi:predicted RNA-binding protein YlqC (UPF0109 family)
MKELVEEIAKALVDYPDEVQVTALKGSEVTVLELRANPEDLGKIIGRQGRTVQAIRILLGAAGMKIHKRFTLEVLQGQQEIRSRQSALSEKPARTVGAEFGRI